MFFDRLGAYPFFGEQLHGGAEEVVKEPPGEGQRSFDIFDLFQDVSFSFTPNGALFGPAGGDIDAVKGIGEGAGERFPAMGDGIGFEETGVGLLPLVGLDGDVFS
jgi:hypothetical protein